MTKPIIDYYYIFRLQKEWDIDKIREKLRNKLVEVKLVKSSLTSNERLKVIDQFLQWIDEATKILTDPDAKKKYDQALAEWKLTENKDNIEMSDSTFTVEQIWFLIEEGQYLEALQKSKELVNDTPDDDQGWEVYGYASDLCGDTQTAIDATEKAIEINPQRANLYAALAQYYAHTEQYDQAITNANQAMSIDPDYLGYKLNLAWIYMHKEMWGDAEGILTGVLSQNSSNELARYLMVILISSKAEARFPEIDSLLDQNKKREARKILKEVQKQFEEAKKLAENYPELQDLMNYESIIVRRELGVNFYLRVLELVIDLALVSPAILLMSIDNGNNPIAITFGILIIVAVWGYSWVWLGYKNNGQDLTKRLLGMQVVTDHDTYATRNQLIGRAIAKPFAISLGGLFPFLVIIFSLFSVMNEAGGEAAGFIGAMIGFTIGIIVMFFKLGFDLFFVTSKDYLPNFFGWLLFLHEHLTKTTVIASTKDDLMNFGEYHWY